MRLHLSSPGTTSDPLSEVLERSRAFAAGAEAPFGEGALWSHLAAEGIWFSGEDGGRADGARTDEAGRFLAKLALDLLYARREVSRRLGGDGSYLYARSG